MKMIALIDYGSGNIHSAARALRVAANNAKKTREIRVTSDPDTLKHADRIVLPGVGHFADCMANLKARDGLIEALEEEVVRGGKPFLGICVGMQLMADIGLEGGETKGLGWISGKVEPIKPADGLAVPHMGWNELHPTTTHDVMADLDSRSHCYFVHSYAFDSTSDSIVATTEYGQTVTAAIARDNMFGTQFHPEKSQKAGLQILSNFVRWTP
ncbi:MAG: imidazole glycerol phosphate synthase subunit HisH [Hyphomonadaceae bacterium]